ncbi:LacI family DNA-binding transcriptional regulator [Lactococcus protaetiae]|nr:LacI family DNA-binding transcriptional regulator [Lactococcus protaetiae]
MITIKELATLAKVSPTTISNVLHGRTHELSAEKLAKIQKVIISSGYIPNRAGKR